MDKNRKACTEFQEVVARSLVRHRSILDLLSKLSESNARVQRAVAKAVTECGCIAINAEKQGVPEDCCFEDVRDHFATHLGGELCESCTDVVEQEVGIHLFYTAGLCSSLGLDLNEVLEKEEKRLQALGVYNLR